MSRYVRYVRYRGGGGGASSGVAPQGSLVVDNTSVAVSAIAGTEATEYTDDVFHVQNGGPGSLTGTSYAIAYDDAEDWLTLGFAVVDGVTTVTPTIDATLLTESTQEATITITDANASNSGVEVTITVEVLPDEPLLALFPGALSLSIIDETAVGSAVTTTLSDSRGSELDEPTFGTITGSGADYIDDVVANDNGDGTWEIEVTPTATGGTAGAYTALIPVVVTGAANTPITLSVGITVLAATQPAVIVLDRTLDDATGTVGGASPAAVTVGLRSATQTPLAGATVAGITYSGSYTGWASGAVSGSALTVTPDTTGLTPAGTGYAHVEVDDPNAAVSTVYDLYLKLGQAAPPASLSVSPSAIAPTVNAGQNAAPASVLISNAGGGGLAGLGTVNATFSPGIAWANVSYASGVATVTFTTSALGVGTYATSLIVTSSLANNSPRTVPVQVTVQTATTADYPPGPQIAVKPKGWTYNQTLGYWEGSCFDDGGYVDARGCAMPAFDGTVYPATTRAALIALLPDLASGAIADNDVIELSAGVSYLDIEWPVRTGWVEGTSGFVQIRTNMPDDMPEAATEPGPGRWTAAVRATDAHAAFMPTLLTNTRTRSCVLTQRGCGGYWFTGIRMYNAFTDPLPSNRPAYIVAPGGHVGTSMAHSLPAHTPSHIVLDRCIIRSAMPPSRALGTSGARYFQLRQCSLPVNYINDAEPQSIGFMNGWERVDILGCRLSGWGEHILWGGGNPGIQDWNCTDFFVGWNFLYNDVIGINGASDDNKNALEVKTGGRILCAFNVIDGLAWKGDQKFAFLTKGTDQAEFPLTGPQIPFPAHTYDVCFWANDLRRCGKGFWQGADESSDSASAATIGTERIELAWNRHNWDTTILSEDTYTDNDRQLISLIKSQGNGIPGVWIYHNTFGGKQAMMTGTTANSGVEWSNIRVFNNVCVENPTYGGFFGSGQGNNSTGLNGNYGAGVWDMRRNFLLPGGGLNWDATLSGATYRNGLLHSANTALVFQNTAAFNYSLINEPSPGYYLGESYANGYQTTVGYSHAYLAEMTAGVENDP